MAKMKDMLIGTIEDLAKETGYDFDFLMDKYFENVMVPNSEMTMDDFTEITRERDW